MNHRKTQRNWTELINGLRSFSGQTLLKTPIPVSSSEGDCPISTRFRMKNMLETTSFTHTMVPDIRPRKCHHDHPCPQYPTLLPHTLATYGDPMPRRSDINFGLTGRVTPQGSHEHKPLTFSRAASSDCSGRQHVVEQWGIFLGQFGGFRMMLIRRSSASPGIVEFKNKSRH